MVKQLDTVLLYPVFHVIVGENYNDSEWCQIRMTKYENEQCHLLYPNYFIITQMMYFQWNSEAMVTIATLNTRFCRI